MNLLFEEDGAFRAGTILADNNTSLQVESATGKRSKVKTANVLLRFAEPSPVDLLARAQADADAIDVDFLWQASPEAEFGFEELAAEYAGRKPTALEAAAVLLRLHSAPVYFHRKGRGRFRKAPADILQAALAGLEKKRQQALAIERMAAELVAGRLPAEFSSILPELLYKPDRNRPESKALEAACAEAGLSAPKLLARCGAVGDSHDYRLGRFLHEYFPQGTGFPEYSLPVLCAQRVDGHPLPGEGGRGNGALMPEGLVLPLAAVQAFSIDDATTTEIDDAFSVSPQNDGGMWVGIHIAAPGLGLGPDSELGRIARERLSTVYMPGRKITMLPEEAVERFTLAAGRQVPAISLYLDVAPDLSLRGHATRLETVPVAANLRHHDIEPLFNETTLVEGLPDFPFRDELKRLWELATTLAAGRGQTHQVQQRKEYSFYVDWETATPQGPGRVEIVERPRGSPLDTLVAELMIAANATWGGMLRDAGIPALYRAQTAGKARLTTVAAAHEGLGVDCYTWSSSPLRRYVDLLNQWQLIALLRNDPPAFGAKSAELLAALRDFELTYAAYADFQQDMERYWCLRWLLQENEDRPTGHVLRESLVRLERIPVVLRVPSLPAAERGVRVRLAVEDIDLLEAEAKARFIELLPSDGPDSAFGDVETGE